jgi:hypothetical protein
MNWNNFMNPRCGNVPRRVRIGIRTLCIGGMMWGMMACHSSAQRVETGTGAQKRVFTMPAIPQTVTDPSARANYLVTRYWDNFDFSDTAYIHLPEVTEQAIVDYADILPYAGAPVAAQSVTALLSKAEKEASGRMYAYFLKMLEKYLYDPNSPYHDDEFYIPVMEYVIKDRRSSEADRTRAEFTLGMMMKNRRGTTACDLAGTLSNGSERRLHDVKSTYTLLMFYNPDCHACGEMIEGLKRSAAVEKLHANGTLAMFLFYPDEDVSIWKKHLSDIPDSWINGYDRQTKVKDTDLYDLRAIPTLYLLDKDKKVLLKDVNPARLEKWLAEFAGGMTTN